jgi:hypothetical protein
MICRHSLVKTGLLLLTGVVAVNAQAPAPPVPPLTKEQKEAAAAIEAPKTFAPPPAPGQLQGGTPAKAPEVPAKAPEAPKSQVPPPVDPPAGNSASKMQALEAVTQQPAAQAAPRVTTPADKLPVTSSTSASRQFIVHGKVFETRSAMSSRCDEISQELRKVLNDKEPFLLPIVVVLNTGADAEKSKGPPISTAISELTHGGFHLQVTVNERAGLKAEDLRKEVVRALLAERILRNHQKITTPQGRLLLPDWVMTGVLHAMDYRASSRPSTLFATIFRSGKIYGIEEIITASPVEMDGLSRSIYETSCGALVLALIDQPDGPSRFNKFLNLLASDPRSERDLLNVAFPTFAASASSLNKWWSLQLATLSKPGIAEPYTAAESLKAIEDAITIRYEAKPDEVPKNVKPRPFVLPAPLPVAAAEEAAPERTTASEGSPRSKTKTVAAAEEETGKPDEKPKRSLWRRLLFLGDPAAEKPETTEPAAEEDKPGFFGRLFSFGSEDKKPETDKPKNAATEKPKSDAKDKPEAAEEEKKPSLLNPLNWFRGGKEEDKAPDQEKPKKDGDQAASGPLDIARLISPALADAWQVLAPAAPLPTAAPLFDFRKNKTKPEEEKKKEEAAKAKSESSAKPAAKKDDKPRTTNPNAKPASKKATTPSDKPKVTNPNSRPVPAGALPPGVPGAEAVKLALVPVVLPLEEYQHILKHPDRAKILEQNVTALRALELRVSVLFRPVITAYLAAVLDLQAGKTKDMDKRLATLREFALVAYQKSVAVRDYLDWFEASESGRLSGKFDDYLNLPKIIEKELPPRTDPISKYLDAIDKEFSK